VFEEGGEVMDEPAMFVLLDCGEEVCDAAGALDSVASLSVNVMLDRKAEIIPLSPFCLTTKESNSGNHLGHGHAAENVLNRRNKNENTRLVEVLIVIDPVC
jgi:hypothetical protein